MKVKIGGEVVDVLDGLCPLRSCYHRGEDKGTFVQGRGYTSYHRDGPRLVCGQRQYHGCPSPIPPATCCDAPDLPAISVRRPQSRRRCRTCGRWVPTTIEQRRAAIAAHSSLEESERPRGTRRG